MCSLTMSFNRKVKITQRAAEGAILGVFLQDQIGNKDIRKRTRVTLIAQKIVELKSPTVKWDRHITHKADSRWEQNGGG